MPVLSVTVTNIYAPSDHRDTPLVLNKLTDLNPLVSSPWLIAGDFNLLRHISDKDNNNFDLALATSFNNTINTLDLLELPLLDQLFTWTNNRSNLC